MVNVCDAYSGEILQSFYVSGGFQDIQSVISPDGQYVAVSFDGSIQAPSRGFSRTYDGKIKLWNIATGREVLTIIGRAEGAVLKYRPDGRRIASIGEERKIKIWDSVTGQVQLLLQDSIGTYSSLAYSPDGRRIASAGDGQMRIWNADTGRELFSLRARADGVRLVYSPDGRRIASTVSGGEVEVWDTDTGLMVSTLRRHIAGISDLSYSPDGRYIATAGSDGSVKIWDIDTGQEALTLRGGKGHFTRMASRPDGRRIAACDEVYMYVWDATPVQSQTSSERLTLADARWDAWQWYEAKDCLNQKFWFAAAWHLDQLGKRHPDEPDLRTKLATARAGLAEEGSRLLPTELPDLPTDVFAK